MHYTHRYCMDRANRASKRVRYRGYNMVAYKGWSVSRVVENHIFSRALASENWDFLQRVTLIYLFRHTMLYPISDTRHKKGKCSDFCSISRNWNTACISAELHKCVLIYRVTFTFLPRNWATMWARCIVMLIVEATSWPSRVWRVATNRLRTTYASVVLFEVTKV